MKTKILLADDEADLEDLFRQQFRQQIQTSTYEFIFVRDGQQALRVLEQQPDIEVVLSDINMPGMDGLTLLAKLPDINPIIRTVMVTAYGDMSNIRTAMNRGAFDFVTKPIDFKDLKVTLEKTIRSARQLRETLELKAIDEMKTRFFTNITHELRTPLSLIVSPIDNLLEVFDLPAIYQRQLSTVQRNARQLLRLINQLLDINKLEAQKMDLVEEIGDLPGFVGQLVDLFRPATDIKGLVLTYQTDMPTGNYRFDAGKWEKILYNLLSNAIKFTDTGGITVSLIQTTTTAQLRVSDTGIGIETDQLPHIFDRFYQVGPRSVGAARSRHYEGSGIGLALVHELIVKLGGTIRVESQQQGMSGQSGTQFWVELPVQRVDHLTPHSLRPTLTVETPDLPAESVHATAELVSDRTPLVLIVEDNTDLREFIVAELATTYRIRSAGNGYEGWVVAREELPDVIISDVMMPRMDGYELLEHIRTDPLTDHIAVILLTASVESDSRLKGLAFGADAYLTKPFNLGELRLQLRNLLTRQEKLREEQQQQFTQPGSATPLETTQDQFLRRLYGLLEDRLDDSSLSVEWLADQLAMSRKKLYLKIHSLLQVSPNDLIRQYRLRKAIDLLRAGHNASETAYMVGFESPSYFTRVFKEFYQQTPTDYIRH